MNNPNKLKEDGVLSLHLVLELEWTVNLCCWYLESLRRIE